LDLQSIKNFNGELDASSIENKETARVIKAFFEKQNDIIESNKYFVLEMDKYKEEEFRKSKLFISKIKNPNLIVLSLSKYVSNYGTNWVRVLNWIIIFSLIVIIFHDFIPYIFSSITSQKIKFDINSLINIPNRAMELVNPLNVFKQDYNLYKGHEFWAMIVRIITVYLFYQFAMAFRQNTRRK